jgi:hypothetical protein
VLRIEYENTNPDYFKGLYSPEMLFVVNFSRFDDTKGGWRLLAREYGIHIILFSSFPSFII